MIITYGCSFTLGEELNHPESEAWPQRLAELFHTTVKNRARSGASNTDIIHQYVCDLQSGVISDTDLVIIVTTLPNRFSYYDSDHQHMPTIHWMDTSTQTFDPDFVYVMSKTWGCETEVIKYYQNLLSVIQLANARPLTYWQTAPRSAPENALFTLNICQSPMPDHYYNLLSELDNLKYIPITWDDHTNFFVGKSDIQNPNIRQPDQNDVHDKFHPRAHKHTEHAELIYEYLNNHTHTS